jgi:crotonobetaine/carnitine-CoA ligase
MLLPLDVLRSYPPHDSTLEGLFQSRHAVRASATLLTDDQRSMSWDEFGRAYHALARSLARMGIRPQDRVAIVAPNSAGHVLLLFALARLGAIMVPLNPSFSSRELAYALGHADVSAVFAGEEALGAVREALAEKQLAAAVVLVDGQADGLPTLQGLIDQAPDAELPPQPAPDSPCIMIFTSGTTGFPKGALHSQSSFVKVAEANVERLHLQPEDRILVVLPLFHVNALFYSMGGMFAAGATLLIQGKFSASRFWHIAADSGATIVNIIEAMGTILMSRDHSEYRPDHKLRAAYGVRQHMAQAFREKFGIALLFSGFGMTEIPGVTCNPYDQTNKPGSMGMLGAHPDPAQPWAQARVVDDDGRDVPEGETGEFLVKTPVVMLGYFRDPEQTAASFQDGWFKTGDLVRRDADGFFFYVARKKDIIRRRGENIAGAELDLVINAHPSVYESAAVAVPSPLGEDDILTAIVVKPGCALTAAEVAEWCRPRLAPHKVPRYVAFMDELPHTSTHKIAKAKLRADAGLRERAVDLESA